MKQFFSGLITGLLIGGIIYFLVTPGISEKAHNNGYEKGVADGTMQGIAEGKSLQKKEIDSAAAITASAAPPAKPVKTKQKAAVNPNDKNFNVYGNQVAEERK